MTKKKIASKYGHSCVMKQFIPSRIPTLEASRPAEDERVKKVAAKHGHGNFFLLVPPTPLLTSNFQLLTSNF